MPMVAGPVIDAATLPAPRLQLRWAQTGGPHDWACIYEIVIPVGANDVRNAGDDVFVRELGRTRMLGGPIEAPDQVDAPFRDGAHARWDAAALGLPAYAMHGARAALLPPAARRRPT